MGIFKALVLAAFALKMFLIMAPTGPVAAILTGAVLLLGILNLVINIIQ